MTAQKIITATPVYLLAGTLGGAAFIALVNHLWTGAAVLALIVGAYFTLLGIDFQGSAAVIAEKVRRPGKWEPTAGTIRLLCLVLAAVAALYVLLAVLRIG